MRNPSNKLIEDIIKEKSHKDDKLVDIIMETLSLGKEAAYRRLRGEVPYTLDDILIIAAKFNVSLDAIIGRKQHGAVLINADIIDIDDPVYSYNKYLLSQTAIFKEVTRRENGKAFMAFNLIPYVLYSNYQTLHKFRLYRWIHQMNASGNQLSFKDTHLLDEVWATNQTALKEFSRIQHVDFIFDKELFLNQVKEILLFVQLNLIDKETLAQLKNELLQLLEDIEEMSYTSAQKEVTRSIFIANVSFESCYLFFEADDYCMSGLRTLGISVITSQDAWLCQQQRRWIESLKRYSTLISVSGEINRLAFINKQKEYIKMLDI